jgi:hypothetical protein
MKSDRTSWLGCAPFSLRPQRLILAAFVIVSGYWPVWAQEEDPLPPPAKTVAAEDRDTLASLKKPEDYAKRAVELAEKRLKRAEALTTEQNFQAALDELGRYQGVVTHALAFLKPFGVQGLRKPFRTMEVALRAHVPRIEGIRRQTPLAYSVHVRAIGEYARDARSQALNAFFDDVVLAEDQAHSKGPESKEKTESKPDKP